MAALRFLLNLRIGIDGALQDEECKIDVRYAGNKTRVYVRWVVSQQGFEWDGRESAGSDREYHVLVIGEQSAEPVINRKMRCIWFAVGHKVSEVVHARAIFECLKHTIHIENHGEDYWSKKTPQK
jgi:hypothetical protein